MIDSKDISVIFQGAIDKENTQFCLKSIRKYLPHAEVVLSTWEGSDIEGLDYDVVLLNTDPGAPPIRDRTALLRLAISTGSLFQQ